MSRHPRNATLVVLTTIGLALLFGAGTVAALNVSLSGDALGDGLLMFMIYGAVALLAGAVDGWRKNPLAWISVRWLLVGSVCGVVAALNNWSYEVGSDVARFAEDLIMFVIFMAALVGGAGVIGSLPGRFAADRTLIS